MEIILYKRRFYMLVVMAAIEFLNNSIFVSFAPISESMHDYFNKSFFWINALSWATVLTDFALAIPALGFIQRFGCRGVVLSSSVLHFAGCAIRFFGSFSTHREVYFWLLLTGQVLVAIAQPMLNAVPPQVAGDWFGDRERSVVTAVVSMCSLAGLGGGYALFAFMVGPDIEGQLWKALLVQFCVSGALLVASLFYQQSPPTPPSVTMEESGNGFLREMLDSVKNPQFVLLVVIFSLPFGLFIAVWSTLEEILKPFATQLSNLPVQAGIIGLAMIGGGLVGSPLLGVLLDRYRHASQGRWYVWSVRIMTTMTVVAFAAFHVCTRFDAGRGAIVSIGVLAGLCSICLLPSCIECGVEMTYPISEANSGGILLAIGNVAATLYILVLTFAPDIVTSFMAVVISAVLGPLLLIFFRPRYLRLEAEHGVPAEPVSEKKPLLSVQSNPEIMG